MNIIATITLSLILLLTGSRINTLAQHKSFSTMKDIRQVTEMASGSKWEIIMQDKGVTLSSRWLTFGDSLKTREISSKFVVNAGLQSVLENLMQPDKILAWNDGVRSLKLLKREGFTWITHTVYDIPYPFSQQDLVAKNILVKENEISIILISAMPGYIEPLRDITRQQHYFGKWELRKLENRTTEVIFSAISFSKSGIPRFVRDPIIQKKLFHSFLMLKELSSNSESSFRDEMLTGH